jgi:hypothetical protein
VDEEDDVDDDVLPVEGLDVDVDEVVEPESVFAVLPDDRESLR